KLEVVAQTGHDGGRVATGLGTQACSAASSGQVGQTAVVHVSNRGVDRSTLGERVRSTSNVVPSLGALGCVLVADVVDSTVELGSRADLVAGVEGPEIATIAQSGAGVAQDAAFILAVQVDQANFGIAKFDVAVDVPATVFVVAVGQATAAPRSVTTIDYVVTTGNAPVSS